MNIVLWILQVLLALQFAWHGWLFVAPPAELVGMMNAFLPPWFRIFIGVAELVAAAGLILPGVTRILPWLTSLAAAGLMIVTASASVLHWTRGEIASAITTTVLFLLLAFVAYMRWRMYPIASRQQVVTPQQTA